MYVYEPLIIALGAYLLGSIPFGILLAKLYRLPDPRTVGSGNIGATNMLRAGNKKIALATLLLDAGKGAVAVVLACYYGECGSVQALAALMATVGHMYSPWLKFKGGKGVATLLGGLFALSFWLGLWFAVVWLLVFLPTRYVSLASILALAAVPVLLFLLERFEMHVQVPMGFSVLLHSTAVLYLAIASAIAIYKHRSNIARLKAGTEPKMGGKKDA